MEHELGVDGEVGLQPEARLVLLAVVGKLLAEPDEHPVQPPQHVGRVVDLGLEDGDPRHEDGGGLLVELLGDGGRASLGEVSSDGGDAQAVDARGVLVVRDELDASSRVRRRLAGGRDDLEVDGEGGLICERADLPGRRLTDSDFGLSDAGTLLVGRDDVTNDSRDLELLGGL